jgi:hypothetical protein
METQAMPVLAAERSDQPRELPPGVWEPPPVRRGSESSAEGTQTVEETEAAQTHRPRLSKRRAWLAIAGLFLLAFAVLGSLGWWVYSKYTHREAVLAGEAFDDYEQHSYSNAAEKYILLLQKFPGSQQAADYRFMADWCAVCSAVADPDADLPAAAARLHQFIKDHQKYPLMEQFGPDAGLLLLNLAKELAARTDNPPDDKPLQAVESIDLLRQAVAALGRDCLTKDEDTQIEANLIKVRRAVDKARKRREAIAQIAPQQNEPPMSAIKRVRSLLARMEREWPGISKDEQVQAALAQLYQLHEASVVYHPATGEAIKPPIPPAEDEGIRMLFAPLLPAAAPGKAAPNDRIVLALVRGVLYALKQSNGELKWAMPVGIDTTVLPLRVPERAASRELLLVLSADTHTLSALDLDGDTKWEYRVGKPVLGRPIIIEQRAYLADYSGWIHEIELSGGQLLGRWSLGQALTRGGTREGKSSLIYFPADDSCIYVLDVGSTPPRLATILYDWHPSGSLRSPPIVVPPQGDMAPGYLILNQTSGLDATQLKVFELPLQDRHALPQTLDPPARLSGWTWFEPKEDGEKLAVLSDAGILGQFGIRQMGNLDQPLFPLLQPDGLDLSPFLRRPAAAKGRKLARERGRAQVIHMQGNDLWLLAHGRMQRMQLQFDEAGPRAVPMWDEPLMLGSPLHESQRSDEGDGRSAFYPVTQALDKQTCLATKVDDDGHIKWQRQIGLVCQSEPLALTPPDGGPPWLLALDQGGGLFALDPSDPPEKPRSLLAPALADNPLLPPKLLAAADGRSAYEVAAPGDGQNLIVRNIYWAGQERKLRCDPPRQVSLLRVEGKGVRTLAGPPVLSGSQLLLAMTDGTVMRLLLSDENSKLERGPDWRNERAPDTAVCHIVALGGDRFLASNGSRGLRVWEWPADKNKSWKKLSKGDDTDGPLTHLVAAPPVLLPAAAGQQPRIAVADSAGVLHLFIVAADGSLQPGPTRWNLKGNLTSGPFVYNAADGLRIGGVLDRRRLVWLDPAKAGTQWEYPSGGPAILGRPQRIGDILVVALQSGRYVGIDANTGQPLGPGYPLRTSAAPAATPMSFGPGRMFAPLSDGTALLLSVGLLKRAKKQ